MIVPEPPLQAIRINGCRRAGVHLDTVLNIEGVTVPHRQKGNNSAVMKKDLKDLKGLPTLADLEREVLTECREWGRQRLAQRLQALADQTGEVFPPVPAQTSAPDAAHRTGAGQTDR